MGREGWMEKIGGQIFMESDDIEKKGLSLFSVIGEGD